MAEPMICSEEKRYTETQMKETIAREHERHCCELERVYSDTRSLLRKYRAAAQLLRELLEKDGD